MNLMLLNVHILCVLDRLCTVFNKNIKVKKLLVFYFLAFFLDLRDVLFEYLSNQIVDSFFLNTEVKRELEFSHFMDLNSSDDTDNLEKSRFVFPDRLFNAEMSIGNSAFDLFLDLFQKL